MKRFGIIIRNSGVILLPTIVAVTIAGGFSFYLRGNSLHSLAIAKHENRKLSAQSEQADVIAATTGLAQVVSALPEARGGDHDSDRRFPNRPRDYMDEYFDALKKGVRLADVESLKVSNALEAFQDIQADDVLKLFEASNGTDFFASADRDELRRNNFNIEGYRFWILNRKAQPEMIPLMRCLKGGWDHMVSNDIGCELQSDPSNKVEGRYGYVFAKQTADTVQLVRCVNGRTGDHAIGLAMTCPSPEYHVEGGLGYVYQSQDDDHGGHDHGDGHGHGGGIHR